MQQLNQARSITSFNSFRSFCLTFGQRFWTRWLLLLPMSLLNMAMLGCSATTGTVVARSRTAQRAVVQDVYSFGFEIRNRKDDEGFTIGYRHSVYIYPASSSKVDAWSFGFVRTADQALVKRLSQHSGLDVQMGQTSGFSFGYGEQAYSAYDLRRSQITSVKYKASDPLATEVDFQSD